MRANKRSCPIEEQNSLDNANDSKDIINFSRANKKCRLMEKQQPSENSDDTRDLTILIDYDSLAKIFMLLPIPERLAMEEVCLRWKEACQLAWYDIKKYKCGKLIGRVYNNHSLTQSYVQKILFKCGIYLKELSLSEVCRSSIMPIVVDRCQNLTRLELVFDGNSERHNANNYIKAFTQMDKLEYIKIQVITMNKKNRSIFPIGILDSLPDGMKEIHLLFNVFSWEIKPLFFNLNKYNQLHSLTMAFCVLDKILPDILKKKTLVYLDIRNSRMENQLWMFNELINLEHIYLPTMQITKIAPETILSIFNTCKKLKYFEGMQSLMTKPKVPLKTWPNLENIVHFNTCLCITEDFATDLVKYCKNIKYLKIQSIRDTALRKLTELENLEYLIMASQFIDRFKKDTIVALSNNLKKLKHLEIPFCEILEYSTDPFFVCPCVFDELSKLQYLEYLNLSRVRYINDNTIYALTDKCKYLKYLRIFANEKVSEIALMSLSKLEYLQDLGISTEYSCVMSDKWIVGLKGLKSFTFGCVSNFTDAGIIQLMKNCPDLERLYIPSRGSYKITHNIITAADEITKNRKNGIILELFISDISMINSSEFIIINSQFLRVKTRTKDHVLIYCNR